MQTDFFINMSLNHARHNKEVFEFLRTSTKRFYDWEVTTAFYTALQYVNAELFPKQYEHPITKKIQNFESLDEYFRAFKQNDLETNKHRLLHNLVEEYLPDNFFNSFTIVLLPIKIFLLKNKKFLLIDVNNFTGDSSTFTLLTLLD